MHESVLVFLVVGFFVALSALMIVLSVRQRKKMAANFEVFASKLGCTATIPEGLWGGFPSLSGTYRNHALRVFMFKRSSGSGKSRSSTTYTAFELHAPQGSAFEFNIFEQGFFSTIATKLGMQDIEIGDVDFDKEYIIKSNDESRVREFLTPMIKQKFMEFAEAYPGFGVKLQGERFYYESAGTMASESFMERFEKMIEFMCDLADQLDVMFRNRH